MKIWAKKRVESSISERDPHQSKKTVTLNQSAHCIRHCTFICDNFATPWPRLPTASNHKSVSFLFSFESNLRWGSHLTDNGEFATLSIFEFLFFKFLFFYSFYLGAICLCKFYNKKCHHLIRLLCRLSTPWADVSVLPTVLPCSIRRVKNQSLKCKLTVTDLFLNLTLYIWV